ncbi:MAG TPA: RNase adapter RapZ [Acidimicrobiia bacterium]
MSDGPRVAIVTGMSGAGRSHAARALEDLGFFVVDNLPADLIGDVVTKAGVSGSLRERIAVVVDVRSGMQFAAFDGAVRRLAEAGVPATVLFLDADDDALIARFEETRRPHPVPAATIAESIAAERHTLGEVREIADLIIDTSELNVHELREAIADAFGERSRAMQVSVVSFGFKNGVPRIVDLVHDVRFLPNPHWVPSLRPLTGLDAVVREYVFGTPDAGEFLQRAESMLEFLLPRFAGEGKTYLTIGIGCTGGRHRSVAIAEALGEWLRQRGDVDVTIRHRDAGL